MFIRKEKNIGGTIILQTFDKISGSYRIAKASAPVNDPKEVTCLRRQPVRS